MEQSPTASLPPASSPPPWEMECPSLERAVELEREAWGNGMEVSSASRYLLSLLTLEDRIARVASLDPMTGQPLPMAWRRLLTAWLPTLSRPTYVCHVTRSSAGSRWWHRR